MEATTINQYYLLEPFDNKNAGFSRWTFGRRQGKEYFLKEFQDPVYPDETTLSDTLRQNRIQECMEFEGRKVRLYQKINEVSDGNVVRIFEFFRWESRYYLATRRIRGEKISPEEVARLPMEDRLVICRAAAHALMQLHQAGIVHSDIKYSNILLQKTVTGKLTAKLIDFDASFFEDTPPEEEEELNFDQSYLAPEGCLFLLGEPAELTCKMDVFSMGLLMHEYLTGEMPRFNDAYSFAHEAVLDGQNLELDPSLPAWILTILGRMLLCEPEMRCTMEEVCRNLGYFFGEEIVVKAPEKKPEKKPDTTTGKSTMGTYFVPVGDL